MNKETAVWFEDVKPGSSHTSFPEKTSRIFDKANFASLINEGDLVAIKVHFGEPGNTTFVSPIFVRKVVDKVKEAGGRPFVTDANTLYAGRRSNSVDHINAAVENGFAYSVIGAPVIIADGLTGQEHIRVPVNGKHFQEVKIAPAAKFADCLIVISHFKGHMLSGFGGAIKNVGMGLGSRAGKREMHSDGLPFIRQDKCTGCERCIPWCPTNAMSINDGGESPVMEIDPKACISCGECTVSCNKQAIGFDWKTDNKVFQEKMVEYAAGVLDGKQNKIGYINFLTNMTPDCDCLRWSDPPLIGDIGIVASNDMVAIEQASLDLVCAAADAGGASPFQQHNQIDGSHLIRYAEEMGLGSASYKLRVSSGSPPVTSI